MAGGTQARLPSSLESQADQNPDCFGTTPPERQTHLPPTPPATDERRVRTVDTSPDNDFLHMLRSRATSLLNPWTVISVEPQQYGRNKEVIESIVPKHDFEAANKCIVIRMPSPIHESFLKNFERTVEGAIQRIVDGGGDAGDFASGITNVGSARVLLAEGCDKSLSSALRRQPDAQFQHETMAYPGVVIEVSYSQDGKSLAKLAQDYILYSNGNIGAVVGIDINPAGSESAVSLWRPQFTPSEDQGVDILEARQVVSHMPFRTAGGEPANENENLVLYLSDFNPLEGSSDYHSMPLTIALSSLHRFLARAELLQQRRDPDEQLRSDDEAKYADLEAAAAKQADLRDDDFTTETPPPKRRAQ
ncbi:Ent-kaurene oxidase-like protein [Purpureocillium lavendulum]|uniref:Ent-kaurene oxidase-like protein n=1 Tax=Purpureocillium lavendulum TaxID=1247861 RepID=A0AB34FJ00_9HYPO|nr:Ent-kaurene oxidase-like protein [Purpureocillium lavendulum]